MSKNYREIYEKELGVQLLEGVASIHHLNFSHTDSKFTNLVAIPQILHDNINITFSKFPKLIHLVLKAKKIWKIPCKHFRELQDHIYNYQQLRLYVDLRDCIKCKGLTFAIEQFGKEVVETVYKGK